MLDTFKLVRELKIEPYFSVATPFPGSDLYKFAKRKGLMKSYEINRCSDEYNISTSDWSAEELKKFIRREKFKLKFKSKLISFIKDPSNLISYIKRHLS